MNILLLILPVVQTSYVYPNELEIKDTTESSKSASYLDKTINGKLTTQLYDKRDDFSFSIFNFPYLCSDISLSPAYGMICRQLGITEEENVKECYFYINGDIMMNFHDASSACSVYNGTLPPYFNDDHMKKLVHKTLNTWPGNRSDFPAQIWLGVTDELVENEWRQINGDIANITSNTGWWSPEVLHKPNTRETNCITMNTTSYSWEHRNCFEKITGGIVCRAVHKPQGTGPKRHNFDVKYFKRPLELTGKIFLGNMFDVIKYKLEVCIVYCHSRVPCKAVVWTSTKFCYGYDRVITQHDMSIPYKEAQLYNLGVE